jgi:hypothetical protein
LRRRVQDVPGSPPSRLRVFDPDGWSGADIWSKHRAWVAARDAWKGQHGEWDEDLTELIASFDLVPDEPIDWEAI